MNIAVMMLSIFAVVAFKDAAKIKSWDAWNDHKGVQAWKERTCVTWRKLNATGPALKQIGVLKTRTAKEIKSSKWSVGCETLDRDYADWNQYKRFLGELGAKRARFFSGWAKTEQQKGVYDFSWLDPQIREANAMGVKPWICISYGNPVWGSDFRLGMRVKQVTGSEEAFAAWIRYVRALVKRYRDVVDEWEIWNEPFGQAEEYAKMVYETAKAIREEQPVAKCIVTAINFGYDRNPNKNEYRTVAEKLKAENALDLVKYWVFHPYCANPDWAFLTYSESEAIAESNAMSYHYRRYFAPEFAKFLSEYSKDWVVIQGEVGCPSQLEFAHALQGIEWTEYAQAKWNLRLHLGAAARDMPSNLFTFIDLQYTFMLQSFGLIRSNTLKEPVYRRPSYYAMRNFYSIFDDEVSPVGFAKCKMNGKELSIARFTRGGSEFAVAWFSGERPGDSLTYEECDLSSLKLSSAEWIDLLTGRIYELEGLDKVPLWDSPVIIATKGMFQQKEFTPESETGVAIQKAIDAASAAGGGRVVLKPAVYPSGTLYLKSNVELHIPEGAVIKGGDNPSAYDDVEDPRIRKKPEKSAKVFIACIFQENVAITGGGVIDGQGVAFYDKTTPDGRHFLKPPHPRTRMIEFVGCKRVRFEGVTFKDSPGWTCWLRMCENVEAEKVKILADQRMINNDGFHVDGCKKVHIRGCDIRTGDDCIVMRAIRTRDGESDLCSDMIVEDCRLDSTCQCIRLGCPSDGTIQRGLFRNLKMRGFNGVLSGHPVRYLQEGDHGHCRMSDLVVENCEIEVEGSPVAFWVEPGITLGSYGNVTFRNLKVQGKRPIMLKGTGDSVLKNVRFEGVTGKIDADKPIEMCSAENIQFVDFNITSASGKKSPPAANTSDGWERVP